MQTLENSGSCSIVAYEVVLSKYGREQQVLAWDLILDILEMLLTHVEVTASHFLKPRQAHLYTSMKSEIYLYQ